MKLKEVKSKYYDKYVIEVRFMHGDADSYTTEDCVCDDEDDFKFIVMELTNGRVPTPPAEGGNANTYRDWAFNTFGSEDFLPRDVVYDCYATYRSFKPFLYDGNGKKWEIEL